MTEITLKCFYCGKEKSHVVGSRPAFAFELVQIAQEAGLHGVFDFSRNRALVFCDERCCSNSITKKGTFRARPDWQRNNSSR